MNEFEFLKNIRAKYSLDKTGDDCAVIPSSGRKDLLITSDLLIEDVDFRTEWTTPEFLGHKALAVSLSDIAAMGGKPTWAMLSLGIPSDHWNGDLLDKFYHGWHELAAQFDVELIGGDISRSPDKIVIDSIVAGEVPNGKAFRRSTARPGDLIFVSGSLGGAAGGLALLEKGIRLDNDLPIEVAETLLKQLRPYPELTIANTLSELDIVTAAIDTSDGLSSDLGHICSESHVGAVIKQADVPVDPLLIPNFPTHECLQMALNGGEDFRLLFTIAPENAHLVEELYVTRIGEITSDAGKLLLETPAGFEPLDPKGFRHF